MASRAASLGEVLGRLLLQEEIELDASAAAGMAALRRAAVLRAPAAKTLRRARGWRSKRQDAVAGRHHHVAQVVGVGGLHLEDARIVGARRAVGALHQFHALGEGGFGGRGEHRDRGCACAPSLRSNVSTLAGPGGDAGGHARGLADLLGREIVAVGVAGALAGDHAHARRPWRRPAPRF